MCFFKFILQAPKHLHRPQFPNQICLCTTPATTVITEEGYHWNLLEFSVKLMSFYFVTGFQVKKIIFSIFGYTKFSKGQLNSEWIHEVIVSSKMPTKNLKDFCHGSLLEGRASNLWLVFWEKWWTYNFILNLTDL